MTTITTSTRQPRSTQTGWLVLGVGSLVAFFVGAAAQLAAYIGFGLCMDEDEALCEPGTLPTTLEWVFTTVPTYLIWLAPSVIAMVIGLRALRSGNGGGKTLLIVAGALIVLITAACTAMWWLQAQLLAAGQMLRLVVRRRSWLLGSRQNEREPDTVQEA